MNLQQLRYLCAIVDPASTSPMRRKRCTRRSPCISKQVRQLEDELGVRVFVRQGKRLASLTSAGEAGGVRPPRGGAEGGGPAT